MTQYHGKCENLHGHTYKLQVTVKGTLNEEDLVLDFIVLKNIVKEKVLNKLDHTNLNDRFTQPSTENILIWIWNEIKDELKGPNYELYELKLWETPTSFATYRED
ncbi:6-pyruvoyltetrahydropterin/6-carboxytetrahydropterin synthase [Desulfonispora thiosulfatigenes DSM 11270]|uniref:6-carboxy-5,6,7,8-tetrahydropterin synthase n=1 Tax=Desulfonispora thiosulfatigenes DSM 11270 TaxID=656914 RepID=A0A1W1VEP7_DESTI|nr:6-carboxytetrahydropterin synthase [Desulfonispora thiosulfatigenes]SMB91531.1 6-pyruvoyltetrahydropterin/6-carboxytetrahydropterin synthase [Desulfonispora thiosulfatigenes DSM 11270]